MSKLATLCHFTISPILSFLFNRDAFQDFRIVASNLLRLFFILLNNPVKIDDWLRSGTRIAVFPCICVSTHPIKQNESFQKRNFFVGSMFNDLCRASLYFVNLGIWFTILEMILWNYFFFETFKWGVCRTLTVILLWCYNHLLDVFLLKRVYLAFTVLDRTKNSISLLSMGSNYLE